MTQRTAPVHVCMISIHGLIRGHDLELGRDADTGGQTRYVVELARALGQRDDVGQVELMTRLIDDPAVSDDYARPSESLGANARIVRLAAGPPDYIRKEELWPWLDEFVERAIAHLQRQPRLPDVLHSHYADAGWVGVRVSRALGIPLVHTGHSLGREKLRRLLDAGLDADEIERRYHISTRIAAEEQTLAHATLVVASTTQEIETQYGRYEKARPGIMHVIPPGTDLECFHDGPVDADCPVAEELERFLNDPDKPIILVIARPDPRKNLVMHVDAYAQDEELCERANLVVVAGTRDDIEALEDDPEDVLTDLLLAIDRHDLYGRVAYPKDLAGDDIPDLFRLAAGSRGVHVNAALTEPFGLTLIEAAACGLPIVATSDGGPRDIIERCGNGVLVDPLSADEIAAGVRHILFDDGVWDRMSRGGLAGVRGHYSWPAHAESFLEALRTDVLARPPHARARESA